MGAWAAPSQLRSLRVSYISKQNFTGECFVHLTLRTFSCQLFLPRGGIAIEGELVFAKGSQDLKNRSK